MPPLNLAYLRDDLRMSTWLLSGAASQCVICLVLPTRVACLPTFLILLWRFAAFLTTCRGITHNRNLDRVVVGRHTAQIPHEDGSPPEKAAEKELTVLVLGARSNHPMGRFAPGFDEVNNLFTRMWRDLNQNREKWGYLGKTSTLLATDDEASNTMVWISYWKDIDHLRAFAHGDAHRAGWDWYNAFKGHPYIGIMHEIYSAPKGHWETIYHHFRPFGMGQTKHVTTLSEKDDAAPPRLTSPLQPAKGSTWKSMTSRMGRAEVS